MNHLQRETFLGEIQNANTAATDFSNSHRASIFHAQQQISGAIKKQKNE